MGVTVENESIRWLPPPQNARANKPYSLVVQQVGSIFPVTLRFARPKLPFMP